MTGKKSGKYKWWIITPLILLIIACPFICLFVSKVTGLNWGEPYTLGLSLKDFITPWIAFWGVLGVVLGVIQMQRRISIQEKQQETQKEQMQIQQKQLRNTRFSSGVELLGNDNESARIGGVYNLHFLADEYADEYLLPVCEIFCAHVCTITSDAKYRKKYSEKPSNEIQTIVKLLFKQEENDKLIFDNCKKNLTGVFLHGADFHRTTLNHVTLKKATLSHVDFGSAALSDVDFTGASLSDVDFWGAALNGVNFREATLNSVDLSGATLSPVILSGATLTSVDLSGATLNSVCFVEATLNNIDFWDTILKNVDFAVTSLGNYEYEEITRKGRSLELTKKEEPTVS